METIDMARWGFGGRAMALAAEFPDLTPGRVVSQEKGRYRVICEKGGYDAGVSGKFRFEAAGLSAFPAVGDFVLLDSFDGGQAVIRQVLARRSVFIRKAAGSAGLEQVVAANVDTLFICMSLNNDFNLRRLERYLAIAWDSGAAPVVVLTKADLCGDAEGMRAQAESVAPGAEVLAVSSLGGEGYDAVLPYLKPGSTVAFVGSSGVGKSTLINRLLGEELLATNGLRNDDKGRHTTTRRQLLPLPCGAVVIDTPGMRELGMWDAGEGLERGFADVEALAERCRFRDCGHEKEPGCAVRAAIDSGELSEERWQSYKKLRAENARAASGEAFLAAKEQKFKEIAKLNKQNHKK